jgi:hypothetical protein
MAFWLVLIAILYLLFACGRLIWPNPDDSLEHKNQKEFYKIIEASRGYSFRALLHKLLFPLIAIVYFPFYKPGAGLAVAVVLLGIAFAI